MNRQAIFKEIKSGKSKQEIYDSLIENNISRGKAAKILNGLPSYVQLKKFRILNLNFSIIIWTDISNFSHIG